MRLGLCISMQLLCERCGRPLPDLDELTDVALFGVRRPCICHRPNDPLTVQCPACGAGVGAKCCAGSEYPCLGRQEVADRA